MARVRVQRHGKQGFADVDTEATNGATLGVNLFRADGSVVTEEDLSPSSEPGARTKTLWSLLTGLPAIVTSLVNLSGTGFVRKSGSNLSASDIGASDAYDAVKAIVQQGSNVTVTADDGAKTLTLAASAGSGAWTLVQKSADESRSSTTTFANDSALTIALSSGVTYHVRGVIYMRLASSTASLKWQIAFSAATSYLQSWRSAYTSAAAGLSAGTDNEFVLAANAMPSGSYGAGGGGSLYLRVAIDLVITPSANGTLSLQWAQVTSDASQATVVAGSYLEHLSF